MKALPGRVRRRMLVRSLAVQGSWNYETLIGTGFAFTLVPALRYLSDGDEDALNAAVQRHAALFNSHPYLATVAAGAVARLEAEGTDPRVVDRFKSALRGSLGSIGDQLFWSAWRPAVGLLGVVLLLSGVVWWLGISLFLVVYNSLHLWLRAWGLRIGKDAGLEVGKVLREAPLQEVARRAADAGAALAGVAVVLYAAPSVENAWAAVRHAAAPPLADLLPGAAVLVAVGLGLWLGLRTRQLMGALVMGLAVVAILLGLIR